MWDIQSNKNFNTSEIPEGGPPQIRACNGPNIMAKIMRQQYHFTTAIEETILEEITIIQEFYHGFISWPYSYMVKSQQKGIIFVHQNPCISTIAKIREKRAIVEKDNSSVISVSCCFDPAKIFVR